MNYIDYLLCSIGAFTFIASGILSGSFKDIFKNFFDGTGGKLVKRK